jgi:tetratricopeptide (TPR) repeat protein
MLKKSFLVLILLALIIVSGPRVAAMLFTNLLNQDIVQAYQQRDIWSPTGCIKKTSVAPELESYARLSNQLDLQNQPGLIAKGRLQWLQGQCEAAVTAWRKALNGESTQSVTPYFELGRVLYLQGQRPEAVSFFKEVGAAKYFTMLGLQAKLDSDINKAREFYQLALDIQPSPEIADSLASIYVEQKQPEQATSVWLKLAQATTEKEVTHWIALGEASRLRQDWPAARQAFEQAIGLSDDPYDLYLRQSRILAQLKDWSGILSISEKAVQLKPRASSEPYRNAGNAATELQQYSKAMEWYNRALEAIPNGDPWPDIYAARTAIKFGYLDEAARRYQAALKRSPDHFGALYELGLLKEQQGLIPQAIETFEKIESTANCGVLSKLIQWNTQIDNQIKVKLYRDNYNAIRCK